ncbi:MAG: hypothetical protein AAF587_44075 [Bacteroidota bacterium]
MKLIYEKEQGIRFYKLGEEYILSVLTASHATRTIEILLFEAEKMNYLKIGNSYIDELAGRMSKFPREYESRQLPKGHAFYKKSQASNKPKLVNTLFEIFDQYAYHDPKSNASSLDTYLRALCKCMHDHSEKDLSYELLERIFTEVETYDLIEYTSEWEDLQPVDIDRYPEKESTLETAMITIKGLIGELRHKRKAYALQHQQLRDQLEKAGLSGIPFYQYQGKFAHWNNFDLASILGCLEDYVFASHDRKSVQIPFDESDLEWNIIPDWLIIGIMYE